MKKILILGALLILILLLVSCAPQITDEALEAELAKLTPEQREELLKDLEAKESGAFAGQAISSKYGSSKVAGANVKQVQKVLNKFPTKSCVVSPPGLVGWWTGQDATGSDLLGKNMGIPKGGLSIAEGKVGNAFKFDGVDDYVEVPNSLIGPELNAGAFDGKGLPNFTIAVWVKFDDLPKKGDAFIISAPGVPEKESWAVGVTAYGQLYFIANTDKVKEGTRSVVSTINFVTKGKWYHIAVTYMSQKKEDYKNEMNLYVDGSLVDVDNNNIVAPYDGGYPVIIGGGLLDGNLYSPFKGIIDELAFWYRPLTAQEVKSIYDAGSAGMCPAKCGNAKVDGNEGCDDGNTITETCPYGSQNDACEVCNKICKLQAGRKSYCGDINVDSANGEQCDSFNFARKGCQNEGFAGGQFSCDNNCKLDTSKCTVILPSELKSDFFKNSYEAINIVLTGQPYDPSAEKLTLVTGEEDLVDYNRDSFAYKLMNGFIMLGYHYNLNATEEMKEKVNTAAEEKQHLFFLKKFQKKYGFEQSNSLTKEMLLKMDQLLAEREVLYKQYAKNFPLFNRIAPLHPNDVSKEFVATMFVIPNQVLPEKLQMKTEDDWIKFFIGQGNGYVGKLHLPEETPGGHFSVPEFYEYFENSNVLSEWLFSALFYNSYPSKKGFKMVGSTGTPGISNRFFAFMHEYEHQLERINKKIKMDGFHDISFIIPEEGLTPPDDYCLPIRKETTIYDFITWYSIAGATTSDKQVGECGSKELGGIYESSAEFFAAYVITGEQVRVAAQKNAVIAKKYNWLRDNVFEGKEYLTDLQPHNGQGYKDETPYEGVFKYFNGYTYPAPVPGYLRGYDSDFIWDGMPLKYK